MPMLTRSKARLGQPPVLVASPRDGGRNRPRSHVESRQGNAVVADSGEVGSILISESVANGSQYDAGFSIFTCKSNRCLTCPKLSTSKTFQSNVTHKTFEVINHSKENITCHSQNLIYLLSCRNCNFQYVGETTIPLHKRINIHRKAKSGCEYFIKHFKDSCKGSSFSV